MQNLPQVRVYVHSHVLATREYVQDETSSRYYSLLTVRVFLLTRLHSVVVICECYESKEII